MLQPVVSEQSLERLLDYVTDATGKVTATPSTHSCPPMPIHPYPSPFAVLPMYFVAVLLCYMQLHAGAGAGMWQ